MAKAIRRSKNHTESQNWATSLVVPADERLYPLRQIRVKVNGASLKGESDLETPQPALAEAQPLGSETFPDGTIADLVRNPALFQRPAFVIWKDGTARIQECFRYGGHDFIPLKIEPSLFAAIQLPSGVEKCGDAPALLSEIRHYVAQYVEIEPQYLRLVANFVLSTWFADCCEIAPYLWVIGPSSAGKTTLLRILHALCRRAVLASDVTPAALYEVPSVIMPTLLLDEFEVTGKGRDLLRFLRSGSTQGGQVIRRAKISPTFCAKVIVSTQQPSDGALASRAIFIPMLPTSRELPRLDRIAQENVSHYFQPRLLAYRLEHYSVVESRSRPRVPGFTPRISDIASALAAPFLGNPHLEAQLCQDLGVQDKEAQLARHGEPEWAVATAIYHECHRGGTITVGDLAFTVNDGLAESGETYKLSPRAVGDVLRSLGLATEKLGNQGRGFRLTSALRHRVHQLARDLRIKRSDILPYITVDAGYAGPSCYLCEEFGLMVRDDGTKLRSVNPYKRRPGRSLYT
ncbi:MAG: hypothetical protein LAO09_22500 [Acidobacteriia bacterium]|nr:hypothetical protein [Terriglobia bacterium]